MKFLLQIEHTQSKIMSKNQDQLWCRLFRKKYQALYQTDKLVMHLT